MKKSPATRGGSDMDNIEWQFPVTDSILTGKYYIDNRSKIHCYVNGVSLCSKHMWIMMDYFKTTDLCENDIDTQSEYFCKKCVKKFKKLKESDGRQ